MIISTIYDEELKEKVFQVRDEEGYTNSTKTSLAYTYVANHRSYLTVNLTASVENHLGASSVAFYDGDELLGLVSCNANNSSVSLQNIHTDYVYHKFRAEYLGNVQSLKSKSPIVEVNVLTPELPTSNLIIDDVTYNPNQYGTLTITGRLLRTGGALSSKSVGIYINNELVSTQTTNSNGEFTYTETGQQDVGRYIIKCEFIGDDSYLASDRTETLDIGRNITISPLYPKIAIGDRTEVEVEVKTWDNEPLANKTIILR